MIDAERIKLLRDELERIQEVVGEEDFASIETVLRKTEPDE